jgi:hypothetical protein
MFTLGKGKLGECNLVMSFLPYKTEESHRPELSKIIRQELGRKSEEEDTFMHVVCTDQSGIVHSTFLPTFCPPEYAPTKELKEIADFGSVCVFDIAKGFSLVLGTLGIKENEAKK